MTVVSSRQHAWYTKPGDFCSFCGEKAAMPYVEWHVGAPTDVPDPFAFPISLVICAKCCKLVRHGLMRDLTETIALADFRTYCRQPVTTETMRQ